MEIARSQRIGSRLERKFKRSVFSGLFRKRSKHNRTQTVTAHLAALQAGLADRCSYRTRLEIGGGDEWQDEHDSGSHNGEDIPLRRFPRRYEALLQCQHHGPLEAPSTSSQDTDHNPEQEVVRRRTSLCSLTNDEAKDAQGDSQPTKSISSACGRLSIGSWSHIDSDDVGTYSIFRNRERPVPGEIQVLDSDIEDSQGHISFGRSSASSQRGSLASSKLYDTDPQDDFMVCMRPDPITLSDMALSVISTSSEPKPERATLEASELALVPLNPDTAESAERRSSNSSAKDLAESWEDHVTLSDMASSPASSSQPEPNWWEEHLKERGLHHMLPNPSLSRHRQEAEEMPSPHGDSSIVVRTPPRESGLEHNDSECQMSATSSTHYEADDEEGDEQVPAHRSRDPADLLETESHTTETSGSTSPIASLNDGDGDVPITVGRSLWRAICDAGNSPQYLPRRGG